MRKIFLMIAVVLLAGCTEDDPVITPKLGTFTDPRDQHQYQTTEIGDQVWMASNLAYMVTVNPSSDRSPTEARQYVYGYEGTDVAQARASADFRKYGVLYNWAAAKIACPAGWGLPTNKDWQVLAMTLGIRKSEMDYIGEITTGSLGAALKAVSDWNYDRFFFEDSGPGNNSSQFSAYPAGNCGPSGFVGLNYYTDFWTQTERLSDDAWTWGLMYYDFSIYHEYFLKDVGLSVRCIKL